MSNIPPTLSFPNQDASNARPAVLDLPGAIIYHIYDAAAIPPKPANGHWTRFVCISDTHEQTFPVPPGDVLLHSGDLTGTGMIKGMKTTVEWLRQLPHPIKIVIAGNHDLSLHDGWYQVNYGRWHAQAQSTKAIRELIAGQASRDAGIVYLEDQTHVFQCRPDGKQWSVYGSPWTPDFWNWGFNYPRGEPAQRTVILTLVGQTFTPHPIDLVSSFPRTDILLTHGPPHGILDRVDDGSSVGCEALSARLTELRPRLHLFGHIHEAHGVKAGEWAHPGNKPTHTVFVNAATYGALRAVVVDLSEDA
ncbi:Metallo-dependent phosphatase-like protein [Gloeopeniophorella convolvens]|nr:Metallo-dependent phosphatase-like protein [Gloeopeniophorella convolvens]